MKLLKQKYILATVVLLISALSLMPLSACGCAHNDENLPDIYFASQSPISTDSLLPPSFMNYGVPGFACNPRESRRMSEAESAALAAHVLFSGRSAAECWPVRENHTLNYVSLRRHGFAYTGGEDDPFPSFS